MMEPTAFGIPLPLWYPILAIGFYVVMMTLVPRKYLQELFITGLLWGTLASWIFATLSQALNLYQYQHLGPFSFVNGPVWLHLSWASAVAIFVYYRPPMRRWLLFWSYLLTFSLLSAMLDKVLNQMGLLEYVNWSPWARFLVDIPWFWGTVVFHNRYIEDRQANQE